MEHEFVTDGSCYFCRLCEITQNNLLAHRPCPAKVHKPQDDPKEGDVEENQQHASIYLGGYKAGVEAQKECEQSNIPTHLTALQQIRMRCIKIAAPLSKDNDQALRVAAIFERYILGTQDAQEEQSDV